jgi:hypothetical protein
MNGTLTVGKVTTFVVDKIDVRDTESAIKMENPEKPMARCARYNIM